MRSDTKLAFVAALTLLPGVANASPSSATAADLGMGAASGWLFFLVLGAAAVVAGVLFRMSQGATRRQASSGSYRAEIGNDPFEARLAARLAELQGEEGDPAVPPRHEPVAAAPIVRGFGRKQA